MKKLKVIPLFIGLVIATILLVQYSEHWLRSLLLYLSTAVWARELISNLPLAKRVSSRFVAGETIADAITAAQELNTKGLFVTMDYLGESVTTADEALAARDEILRLLDHIHQSGVNANVSIKLSQLGIKLDTHLALNNMRTILTRARQYNNRIRIDMEESALIDTTLNLYRTLRHEDGFNNVGVVLQAYLYRTEQDVRQLIEEGAWIRLCKGAYAEPPERAFPDKADTDANFITLTQMLLSQQARQNGVYIGVATHDEKMINATFAYVQSQGLSPDEFEFQMLYGIRRDLQEQIVAQGYRMRIYVPYGTAWYPYFVRRLAERPANLWFFISNFFR
ncbi:MAG: proline dehydrogenase family protein [Ardenticatenaceae bacterium]|nr:proline dehydrogenase family protein [Ardenticatenaceae bacterium]